VQLAISLGGLAVAFVGCGGDDFNPEYRQVSGTVTLDGVPLNKGTVSLMPDAGTNTAAGEIDSSGKFQLSTHKLGDGVPPGKYRAGITAWEVVPEMQDDGTMVEGKSLIPEKYMNPQTSGLTAEITDEASQEIVFRLRSK
jgi:hypothetical protein